MKKPKLSREQKIQLDNDRYKQLVIDNRVSKLWMNRPADQDFYNTELDIVTKNLDQKLLEDQKQAEILEEKRYLLKKGKIEQRFENVNDGIQKAGDIIFTPFGIVEEAVFSVQDSAFKITDSFTSVLTSPILLIAVAGGAYLMLSKK